MAITPTGAIYKALEFDGESSRDYGVYITGEAVFNAPKRDVEMITIPGRNGAFALDNGRFENIEVTYPAGIFADNEADFAEAVSEFRNFLCSRKGYVRLTDDYNPDEYRLAIYKSGLEVDPAFLKAGQFNITFECKPQRFLTSGEAAITVQDGDTITNPTLFESGPLLEVEGYGNINVNGYSIDIDDQELGEITISEKQIFKAKNYTLPISSDLVNVGDTITVRMELKWSVVLPGYTTFVSASDSDSAFESTQGRTIVTYDYQKGTPLSLSDTITLTYDTSGTTRTVVLGVTITSTDNEIQIARVTTSVPTPKWIVSYTKSESVVYPIHADSSKSVLGTPTYIDCDLGEAYLIEGGEVYSLNRYIYLGSKLPTLSPGSNVITFENTISDFKIVPRWWKV